MTTKTFKYTPIAFRILTAPHDIPVNTKLDVDYESSSSVGETHSASGILIVELSTLSCVALTSSPALGTFYLTNKKQCRDAIISVLGTFKSAFTTELVEWLPFRVKATVALPEVNRTLFPFLSRKEYGLGPKNLNGNQNWDVCLSVLELEFGQSSPQSLFGEWNVQTWPDFLVQEEVEKCLNSQVQVQSSPFVLVNPVVFTGHVSRVTLAYVAPNPQASPVERYNRIGFFLTDGRYLDGMEGGAILLKDKCIGIMVGQLIKQSGEGEMQVSAPWSVIRNALEKIDGFDMGMIPPRAVDETVITKHSNVLDWVRFNGVVLIEVEHEGGRESWGSGIVLNKETGTKVIVTNKHLFNTAHRKISIWYSQQQTQAEQVEILLEPLIGFDLILLSCPESARAAKLSKDLIRQDQHVYSMGYGLIYPQWGPWHRLLQPILSHGHVASVTEMQLFPNTADSEPKQVMAVCTSGCWNGSSGGAVFDAETGAVVSLMTSNGRVSATDRVVPELAFTLPSSVIAIALDTKESRTVDSRLTQLWQLKETHRSYETKL